MNRGSDRTSTMMQSFAPAAIAFASVLFSLVLACAMPLAGLAALAALLFGLRRGVAVCLLAWGMNQAVGYGFLAYPHTIDSIGWGIVLGASAAAAVAAAHRVSAAVAGALRVPAAFATAFTVQQGIVLLISFVLPSHPEAFALQIIVSLLAINALAFAVLFGFCTAVPSLRRPALVLAR